jgi:hypothetical protein
MPRWMVERQIVILKGESNILENGLDNYTMTFTLSAG